ALLALASFAGQAPRAWAEPGLFLSWRAPRGFDRARDTLVCAARDTGRVDTLYLSFEVDHARAGLLSMESDVYFTAQPGDSLGAFWSFKRGTANGGNMWIEFSPFRDVP